VAGDFVNNGSHQLGKYFGFLLSEDLALWLLLLLLELRGLLLLHGGSFRNYLRGGSAGFQETNCLRLW